MGCWSAGHQTWVGQVPVKDSHGMTGSKLSFGVGVEEDCPRKYLPSIVGYLSGWTSVWR